MLRRWWHSLGFYWQIYLVMALAFGGIITLVEAVIEPFALRILIEYSRIDALTGEIMVWIIGVLLPTLALGFVAAHIVMRKMTIMVRMAKRLTHGDLSARIQLPDNKNDVFSQMSEIFNDMAQSLQRLLDHEKRLLADISHELRSPLTRMSVAVAILPLKNRQEEVEHVAKILDAEIDHMNTLVGMLLEHARDRLVNQGDYSVVNLSRLVADAADAHSISASAGNVEISVEIEPGVHVRSHPARLRMILDNILSNAEFYAPPNTAISVTLSRDAENASVRVRDHGPGVPQEHLSDIFKAFFRVDESRARTSGGVGLGLALAHDAAVAMGGTRRPNAGNHIPLSRRQSDTGGMVELRNVYRPARRRGGIFLRLFWRYADRSGRIWFDAGGRGD